MPGATPVPEVSDDVARMPLPPGLASLSVADRVVEASHTGGCPAVYYLGEWITGDQCGPDPFDLKAASTRVAPGAELVLTAPDGWAFSVASMEGALVADPTEAWTVTIAPVGGLSNLPLDRQESIYLSAVGVPLGDGLDPSNTVSVTSPTMPGEYLLELRASVARDGWTWSDVLYHWRVSIG